MTTTPSIVLLRGVQGAGKTTLAHLIAGNSATLMLAADDHFYQPDGSYLFDPSQLHHAHTKCLNAAIQGMVDRVPLIVVHNTFSRSKELVPYMAAAEEHGYRSITLVVENRHGNVDLHGVPQEVREEFAKRIKSNIKLI